MLLPHIGGLKLLLHILLNFKEDIRAVRDINANNIILLLNPIKNKKYKHKLCGHNFFSCGYIFSDLLTK